MSTLSLARDESCLQAGTIAHSDSSRTILHPQLFTEPCINSRLLAVNEVNGLYSPKVMTRQYAVMLGNIFHLSRKLKHKHAHFLQVHLVQLDLYMRGSILLGNTNLSKIYLCDCGIWMNTHKQMKRRMQEVLAVIYIVETDLARLIYWWISNYGRYDTIVLVVTHQLPNVLLNTHLQQSSKKGSCKKKKNATAHRWCNYIIM